MALKTRQPTGDQSLCFRAFKVNVAKFQFDFLRSAPFGGDAFLLPSHRPVIVATLIDRVDVAVRSFLDRCGLRRPWRSPQPRRNHDNEFPRGTANWGAAYGWLDNLH